ncbi:MAG: ribonuclease P protein component [Planctomycetia bacterium]|nr:MAG: ribonuclease P protein component [Planctomycetia bacterium]
MTAARDRLRLPAAARLRSDADFRRALDEGLRVSDAVLTLWVVQRAAGDAALRDGDAALRDADAALRDTARARDPSSNPQRRDPPAGGAAGAPAEAGGAPAEAGAAPAEAAGAPAAPPCTRIGIRTGRRLGNSPQRSRVRRVIREAFRLSRPELPKGLDVVCAPRARTVVTLAACRAALESLLARAARRLTS